MKAYFLSDLHLGAPYFNDNKEAEKRVVSFLDHIKDDADAVFLVGDILDYWYEYRYVVPRGFVRFFGKLAELADSGIRIVWFIGNHDIWIFDYLPNELGIEVVDGYMVEEIDGKKFFMTHGDGVGKLPASFKLIRGLFRNHICQKLFAGIHPRWTVPFAYKWSDHSRNNSPLPSKEDAERMIGQITDFSSEFLQKHPDINFFIYGHLHLLERFPVRASVPEQTAEAKDSDRKAQSVSAEVIVLGEWLSQFSYAVWDGEKLELCHFKG